MNLERNRLSSMILLRDRLAELFELIGIEPKKVTVAPRSKVLELLELIVRDNGLYDYLESLDEQTVLAIRKMKDRNLDAWNSRENERLLEKMLDEGEDHQARLEALAKEKEAGLAKISALSLEKEELRHSCALLAKDLEEARQARDGLRTSVEELHKERIRTIKAMISMRDTLLMRAGWIAENAPEETAAAKLVETQLQETARLLQDMGVEIMEDTGRFDSRAHTVVGTVPAVSEGQIDHIAQTVRPGYRFRGESLRSQEVIIYVNAREDT